jgi:putative addiction module killer protein
VIEIRKTEVFDRWLAALRDSDGRVAITRRIALLALGHLGDVRTVAAGLYEMRIHCGPGYRVYFVRAGTAVVLLLVGGDKGSQVADIRRATRMAREI